MAKITVATDNRGDMVAHVGGCKDLTNPRHTRQTSGREEPGQSYEASTWAEAIVVCDTDWAEAFGFSYPVSAEDASEVWSIENGSIQMAPCLKTVVSVERRAIVADAMPKMVEAPALPVKITWWAIPADGKRMRRQDSMRGTWGWDATCSCGWDSRTGGAVFRNVRQLVNEHKFIEHGIESKPRGPKARKAVEIKLTAKGKRSFAKAQAMVDAGEAATFGSALAAVVKAEDA